MTADDSPLDSWIRARGEDPLIRVRRMHGQAEAAVRQRGVPYPEFEDLVQQAFIILSEMWADANEQQKYGNVPEKALHGIANNLVNRFFERRRINVPLEQLAEIQKPVLPLRSRSQRMRCLERHIRKLDSRARRIFAAYYQRDTDREDLAKMAGMSYGTLRVRVLRIKRTLEVRISRCMKASDRLLRCQQGRNNSGVP